MSRIFVTEFETCKESALLCMIPVFDTEFDTCCLQQSSELRLILYFQVSRIITNQNIMAKKMFLCNERAITSAHTPL